MVSTAMIAEIAALAGDPARAAMLNTLMDGRALTATELASVAGITPQTASGHLARLTTAGLLAVEKQGRHRYHRLASQAIAQMIESISQVASTLEPPRRTLSTGPRDLALRAARTCYDHLAGRLGVALADALLEAGHAEIDGDAGEVTDSGLALFAALGVDLGRSSGRGGRRSTRVFCRPCLDWSERRPHLAGAVGAAICTHSFAQGWIRRVEGTRAVSITPKGRLALRDAFGVRLD